MGKHQKRRERLKQRFKDKVSFLPSVQNDILLEVQKEDLHSVCQVLHDDEEFAYEILIDLCGIDYLHYGCSQWATESSSTQGFERGVRPLDPQSNANGSTPRFAVNYQLLSVKHNHRVALKTFLEDDCPKVASVVDIWAGANWFEREAFDLYGFLFEGHPDLRRLLTDYGFIGHPFRKDFPISGHVEMRYDAKMGRVVYEPVDIKPRTLVPKVIRKPDAAKHEHDGAQPQKEAENV